MNYLDTHCLIPLRGLYHHKMEMEGDFLPLVQSSRSTCTRFNRLTHVFPMSTMRIFHLHIVHALKCKSLKSQNISSFSKRSYLTTDISASFTWNILHTISNVINKQIKYLSFFAFRKINRQMSLLVWKTPLSSRRLFCFEFS